jgi:hypothetical protein
MFVVGVFEELKQNCCSVVPKWKYPSGQMERMETNFFVALSAWQALIA